MGPKLQSDERNLVLSVVQRVPVVAEVAAHTVRLHVEMLVLRQIVHARSDGGASKRTSKCPVAICCRSSPNDSRCGQRTQPWSRSGNSSPRGRPCHHKYFGSDPYIDRSRRVDGYRACAQLISLAVR